MGCDWKMSEFMYLGFVLDESGTMRQSVIGRWLVRGRLQMPSGPWLMLGVYCLSVPGSCMRHWSCLFLSKAVRQYYRRRKRGLGLGLYGWTASEVCWVSGEWMKSRMHG